MKYILGEKLGMSQVFDSEGKVIPVTVVSADPNVVLQVRTKEKDSYDAVQVGFGIRKDKNIKKSQKGHFKNLGNFMYVREFRNQEIPKFAPSANSGASPAESQDIGFQPKSQIPNIGDKFDVSVFKEGDMVKVSGVS